MVPRSYEFVTCFVSFSEKAEKYDATGRKVYIAACECLNITPVSFFLRNIQEKKLDFRHRLLGPKGGRAIAAALEVGITWLHLLSILVTNNAIVTFSLVIMQFSGMACRAWSSTQQGHLGYEHQIILCGRFDNLVKI